MNSSSVWRRPEWAQLDPPLVEEFFGVPHDIAFSKDNRFYGEKHRFYVDDTSYPIVMLLGSGDAPQYLKLYTHNRASDIETYNPLEANFCSHVNLDRNAVTYLVSVFRVEKDRVAERPDRVSPTFRQLIEGEIQSLGIRADWFPNTRFNVWLLHQDLNVEESSSSALILSRRDGTRVNTITLRVATFPKQYHELPSFNILDDAEGNICLTKDAIDEVAIILESQLVFF